MSMEDKYTNGIVTVTAPELVEKKPKVQCAHDTNWP